MKKLSSLLFALIFILVANFSLAQTENQIPDSLGLPGDNLNLSLVLNKFQQCKTLEEFEQELNTESNGINNLDLNNDQRTDYIKVFDQVEGNAHTIVLQAFINQQETQDIAVIMVDKDANGLIQVQIIGDPDLYGKDYIIEPYADANRIKGQTPNPGYNGSQVEPRYESDGKTILQNNTYNTTNNYYNNNPQATPPQGSYGNQTYVAVGYWPIWTLLFAPTYVVYVSPYRHGFYPNYYRPWAPIYFHSYYYNHYNPYRPYYYSNRYYNQAYHNRYYYNNRHHSYTVVNNRNNGYYRDTYQQPNRRNINDNRTRPSGIVKPRDNRPINTTPTPTRPSNSDQNQYNRPRNSEQYKPAPTRPSNPRNNRPNAPQTPTNRPAPSYQPERPRPSNPAPRPASPRPSRANGESQRPNNRPSDGGGIRPR